MPEVVDWEDLGWEDLTTWKPSTALVPAGPPPLTRKQIRKHRDRRRNLIALGILVVIAALVLGGLWLFFPGPTPQPAPTNPRHHTLLTRHPIPAVAPTTTVPTQYLSVVPGSGAGCTSGITDGVQWIKYVVKPGDTLSQIANCFDLNGYQVVYQQNQAIIGNDPNLIFPGQTFTITLNNRKMTPSAPPST